LQTSLPYIIYGSPFNHLNKIFNMSLAARV
jgi:hypothetical protein